MSRIGELMTVMEPFVSRCLRLFELASGERFAASRDAFRGLIDRFSSVMSHQTNRVIHTETVKLTDG